MDATRMVLNAHWAGLKVKVFCIVGLPGETEHTAQQTKEWIIRSKPDDFDISPFTPYPGSHVAEHPELYDIKINGSYWGTTYNHKGRPGEYRVMVSTSKLSADRIRTLRDEIERDCRKELGLTPRCQDVACVGETTTPKGSAEVTVSTATPSGCGQNVEEKSQKGAQGS